MSLNLLKPAYRSKPIGSVLALARALNLSVHELRSIASDASSLYRLAKPIEKADGSIRQPFDALPALKVVHKRIKAQILSNVIYPPYLTGSVKGRDYVTNARLHVGKKIVICEDIQSFFPSVSARLVYEVWSGFFGFHPEVAQLMTDITTKDGALPQGAVTSSYLANLVLFKWEPTLHSQLADGAVTYSRYVDDIGLSSTVALSKEQKTQILAAVHGMLGKAGLRAKRKKHEMHSSGSRMIATKLVVNKRVGLPTEKRNAIRAAVHQIEQLAKSGASPIEVAQHLGKIAARVAHLGRFHKSEAEALKRRLGTVREWTTSVGLITGKKTVGGSSPDDNTLPWDV